MPYADKQARQTHKDHPLFEPSTRFNLESMEPHVRLMLQDSDTVDGRSMILRGRPKKHGAAKISQELPGKGGDTANIIYFRKKLHADLSRPK